MECLSAIRVFLNPEAIPKNGMPNRFVLKACNRVPAFWLAGNMEIS
jgi:hypothetical protein